MKYFYRLFAVVCLLLAFPFLIWRLFLEIIGRGEHAKSLKENHP